MSKSIPILAFAIAANAIPWPGPSPTIPGAFAGLKRSAAPTLAPRRPSLPGDHLFRRASTDAYKICGSNVGDDGNTSALTCDDDTYTCYSDASIKAIGCCRSSDAGYSQCKIHTSCVNEKQECLDACISNPLLKKCYSPTPSCGTWVWEDGYSSYDCDTVTFSAKVLSAKQKVLPAKVAASTTKDSSVAAASSGVVTRTIDGTTVISTIDVAQSAAAAMSKTGSNSSISSNNNSNVGPIAGGAAGGGILLLLVIIGIFVFMRRNKKEGSINGPTELDSNALYSPTTEMDATSNQYKKVGWGITGAREKARAVELPSTSEVAELPGGSYSDKIEPRNFSRPGGQLG
ncbi:hypothetical protein BDD12DRAFT_173802 [Trichophaea hybrida]|nr:hypothetical protein BDD12DRAFT_173802 [Trichophaea hybrida]